MNVACTACPAKYAVPDEKVRGKRARITCKHCGNAIIIDGTSLPQPGAATAGSGSEPPRVVPEPPPPGRVPAKAAPAPATPHTPSAEREPGVGPWVVAISDEQQESASIPRIVELFASGTIDADTYLWREGMSEWKTPFEIPQIEAALRARDFFPNFTPPPDEDATQIVRPPNVGLSDRALPHAREDDEVVTVTLGASPGHPARPSLGARPRSDSVQAPPAPSARPAPPSAEAPQQKKARPRTVTRLGMGSPPPPPSEPPQQASSPTTSQPSNGYGYQNGSAVSQRPSGRPLPELHHQGLAPPESQFHRAARRRQEPDANGGHDLFADRQAAELLDDAPTEVYAEGDIGPRMAGARNETSVLFSLDALVKAEQQPERPRRPNVNAAELMYGTPPPPPPFPAPHVPAFAHSLAAPDFTRPWPEPPPPPPPLPPPSIAPPAVAHVRPDINAAALVADDFSFEPPRRRGRKFLVALLLLCGAAGGVFALGLPQKYLAPSTPAPPPQEPPVLAIQPPPPAETAAPTVTDAAPEPEASTAAPAPSAESPPSTSSAAEPSEQPAARASRAPASRSRASHPTETIEEPEDPPSASASSLTDALASEARKSGESKSKEEKSSDEPKHEVEEITDAPAFDRGAAVSALGTAASNAQSCKMLGGPTGSGQATVTFATSGRVTSASVSGDFAGSSVGSCVAKLFRSARVPAFSGSAVTVTKRFSID